jgi:hypothetical protein
MFRDSLLSAGTSFKMTEKLTFGATPIIIPDLAGRISIALKYFIAEFLFRFPHRENYLIPIL